MMVWLGYDRRGCEGYCWEIFFCYHVENHYVGGIAGFSPSVGLKEVGYQDTCQCVVLRIRESY